MYTLYKFHFLNGISEINQLFDDILIIWPAPVYLRAPQSWGVHEEKRCPGYVEHTLRTPLHSHNMTSGAYRGVLYDHVHNPETLLSARTHTDKFILGENILFY